MDNPSAAIRPQQRETYHGDHGDISKEARRPGIGKVQSSITHAFLDSLEIVCSGPLRFCGKSLVRKTSFPDKRIERWGLRPVGPWEMSGCGTVPRPATWAIECTAFSRVLVAVLRRETQADWPPLASAFSRVIGLPPWDRAGLWFKQNSFFSGGQDAFSHSLCELRRQL
jgi:hypothetical protein